MGNLVLQNLADNEPVYEILNGRIVLMPAPTTNHISVAGNIYRIFANYLWNKRCRVFPDGMELHLESLENKEYWIVSSQEKSIEVYLLKDNKYKLDNVYLIYPDFMVEKMDDEEKSEIIKEFKTSLFDDLTISVEDVFYNID